MVVEIFKLNLYIYIKRTVLYIDIGKLSNIKGKIIIYLEFSFTLC